MYQEATFSSLGAGLNLRDKADAVSEAECIDALNVTFTQKGAVEQRAGTDNFTASGMTNAGASMIPYYQQSNAAQLVVGCGTRIEAVLSTDGTVTSQTGLTTGTWGFARFGTPGNESIYFGQGSTNLNKLVNTTFTTNIASTPEAGSLCVMPRSNRLVAGRFLNTTGGPSGGASTSSPSHVYFSDPGAPETWTTTNFIQLTPGDGESVQSVVAWGDFVFIFKESKFFVIYGESTDSGGEPVFNYRTVDVGVGALGPKAVVAGTDGVYFASRRGIYRTTGQTPETLSDAIDPIFDSTSVASDYYLGGTMLQSQAANTALGWHNDRLYVGFTTTGTSNNRTLVFDPIYGWWSLYDFAAAALTSFRISSTPELVYADTTNKLVYRHNATLTNDNGTAITSRWRSGWTNFSDPSRKRIRESKVWGSGTPYMGVSSDYDVGTGSLSVLDLTDPAVSTWSGSTWGGTTWAQNRPLLPDLRRYSAAGTVFSTYFQNTTLDTPWSVSRVTHHLPSKRIPSVIEA